ncbi:hypothetical protein LJIJOHLM_00054 [Escherichia phage KKP 3954]|nr:hypothetical protein LJIJOHLM_00054 [Escherichia phage KKP 3954]
MATKKQKMKCLTLTELGQASNCVTVGKIYSTVLDKDNNSFTFKDDNGNPQVGIYPSCAFGIWEKV